MSLQTSSLSSLRLHDLKTLFPPESSVLLRYIFFLIKGRNTEHPCAYKVVAVHDGKHLVGRWSHQSVITAVTIQSFFPEKISGAIELYAGSKTLPAMIFIISPQKWDLGSKSFTVFWIRPADGPISLADFLMRTCMLVLVGGAELEVLLWMWLTSFVLLVT